MSQQGQPESSCSATQSVNSSRNPSGPPKRKKQKIDKEFTGVLVPANPVEALQNILPTLVFKGAHFSNNFVAWASFAGQHYEATHPTDLFAAKVRIASVILNNFIADHAFVEETPAGTSSPNYNGRIVEGIHTGTYIVGQKLCVNKSRVMSRMYILYQPNSKVMKKLNRKSKEPTAIREYLSAFKPEVMRQLTRSSTKVFRPNFNHAVGDQQIAMNTTKMYKACAILAQLKPEKVYTRINQTTNESIHTSEKCITVTIDGVDYVGRSRYLKKAKKIAAFSALQKINDDALVELGRDRQQPLGIFRTNAEIVTKRGQTNVEKLAINQRQSLFDSDQAVRDVTEPMDVERSTSCSTENETTFRAEEASKKPKRNRELFDGEEVPSCHSMDVVDSPTNGVVLPVDSSSPSEVKEAALILPLAVKVEKADLDASSPIPELDNANTSADPGYDSDVSFANYVFRTVESAFQSLKDADPTIIQEYKALAGVVMSCGAAINGSQVISLATGSECIRARNISLKGEAVNDCHAAILARRGLVSFLYDQLEKYGIQPEESIFEPARNDDGSLPRLKVKEGTLFHLFLSSAPCGDASGQKDPSSAGALQIKTHGFDGTVPVSGFKIQTFEGFYKGNPLLTMSCSDKMARWTVVGAQGSLLSHIINPVYFHSVVIDGDHFNPRFTRRALIKRVKKVEGIPPPFTVTHPIIIGTSTSGKKTVLTPTPNHSICFVKGWGMHEKIDALKGETIDSDGESGLSELRKSRFFQRFVGLVSSNPAWAPLFEPHMDSRRITYEKMKKAAEKFGKTDELLLASLSAAGLGQWMKKPAVQDLFPIFL